MPEIRIAFVRMADHPIPNRLLPPELESAFGGAVLEIFDVEARVRRDLLSMLVNPFFVAVEHGGNLLRGRIRPWRAFFTTTWMFRRMSRLARRWVRRGQFDLSFQMQSLFDARVPGTPHFAYIDHTHLANLSYPDFDRRTLNGARWISLERALYQNAALIFTRSRNITESLVEQYGCERRQIVRVGAGSNVRVPDERAEPAAQAPANILFVGADWDRKGGPDLLQAFQDLRDRHPGARLTIVGCRPRVDTPGVDVVGPVPLDQVHHCFEAASVFCLPSHREPFGVAIIEAMHHGLPVVATEIGAVPDLVSHGENGYLVGVGDVAGLTAALERLLDDPRRSRVMGDCSRKRAREGYTWPNVASRMQRAITRRIPELSRGTCREESC